VLGIRHGVGNMLILWRIFSFAAVFAAVLGIRQGVGTKLILWRTTLFVVVL